MTIKLHVSIAIMASLVISRGDNGHSSSCCIQFSRFVGGLLFSDVVSVINEQLLNAAYNFEIFQTKF